MSSVTGVSSASVMTLGASLQLFDEGLERWCAEKRGEPEYEGRVRAMRAMQECYASGSIELDLNHLGLSTLPDEIGRLRNLQALALSNNQLKTIPAAIGQLQSLQELDLDYNQLQNFPAAIGQLRNLQGLRLDHNELQNLSPEIEQLQNLEFLDLDFNRFQIFPPEIERLRNLKSLHLSNNRLQNLPPGIGRLQHLEFLNLDHNELHTLPPEIERLQNLQHFIFAHNEGLILSPEVRRWVEQLPGFDPIYLEDLTLGQIDDWKFNRGLDRWCAEKRGESEYQGRIAASARMRECYASGSTRLDLPALGLSTLPPEIGRLQNLEELYLFNNRLETLPPAIGQLQKLRSLYLFNNQLQTLPLAIGQLQKLQSLYLSENQLRSLPREIAQLQNLQSLDLGNNQLESLPWEIEGLWNLRKFLFAPNEDLILSPGQRRWIEELADFDPTDLEGLTLDQMNHWKFNQGLDRWCAEKRGEPEYERRIAALARMRKCYAFGSTGLDLSFLGLSTLPPEIGRLQNLEVLYLNGNELRVLPARICELRNLQEFSLNGNELRVLPARICELRNLQQLSLNGNWLQTLPSTVCQLRNLQRLIVAHNEHLILSPEARRWIEQLPAFRPTDLDGTLEQMLDSPSALRLERGMIFVHPLLLQHRPEKVLERLASLPHGPLPEVRFLQDNLSVGDGIDQGGLRKQLMSELFKHLLDGAHGRAIPLYEGIPTLGRSEPLQHLGAVLARCLRNENMVTGRVLPDAYFEFLKRVARSTDEKADVIACSGCIMSDQMRELRNGKINLDKLRESGMFECIDEASAREEIGKYLTGIFEKPFLAAKQVLIGMEGVIELDRLDGLQAVQMSRAIQGLAFDRDAIASRIVCESDDPVVQQKSSWLQDQIRNPETPQKWVEDLLFAVTGQTVLTSSMEIRICPSHDAMCRAHTCFNQLDLPVMHTSAGTPPAEAREIEPRQLFLNNLRLFLETAGTSYQMS